MNKYLLFDCRGKQAFRTDEAKGHVQLLMNVLFWYFLFQQQATACGLICGYVSSIASYLGSAPLTDVKSELSVSRSLVPPLFLLVCDTL